MVGKAFLVPLFMSGDAVAQRRMENGERVYTSLGTVEPKPIFLNETGLVPFGGVHAERQDFGHPAAGESEQEEQPGERLGILFTEEFFGDAVEFGS